MFLCSELERACLSLAKKNFLSIYHVTCPDQMQVSNQWLLDEERIGNRAEQLFDPQKATIHGTPLKSSCTVSFQVVDSDGNAISFVNSNFMGFGTGLVPKGCGFTMQNRGFGFDVIKYQLKYE